MPIDSDFCLGTVSSAGAPQRFTVLLVQKVCEGRPFYTKARRFREVLWIEPADTTSLWRALLREHSTQYSVTAIDSCTLDTFKALIGGAFPPTPKQLLQLEYQQTDKPGVYLSIIYCLTPKHHTYIYIGSATSPNGGMQLRVNQHKSSHYSKTAA